MGDLKSLIDLWVATATTCSGGTILPKSVEYVTQRTLAEGTTFLTDRLPCLAKALIPVFSGGRYVVPDGFRLSSQYIPRLFFEFFSDILSVEGYLRTDLSERHLASRVEIIHNLCYFAYKLEVPSTEKQELTAKLSWHEANNKCSSYTYDSFGRIPALQQARILIHRILGAINPYDITPTHSNGAVAEGNSLSAERRWHLPPSWGKKLDQRFPFSDYYFLSNNHLDDDFWYQELSVEQIARFALVPKDSRGPRGICCEPSGSQFVQQGLMDKLNTIISQAVIPDLSFTGLRRKLIKLSDFIPLKDQSAMQDLARAGSITGEVSTIDLKQASDSIPWNLIRYLFPAIWYDALSAVRSDFLSMDGEVFPVHMAFPMGSSVCFPIECLVFWAIGKAASAPHAPVWVYGDDIIVETDSCLSVMTLLAKCGFSVNQSKSFDHGPFRESCGGDFLFGYPVRAVYLKRFTGKAMSPSTARKWVSMVDFVNRLELKFPANPIATVSPRDVLDQISPIPMNYRAGISYRTRFSRNAVLVKRRWNRNLQREEHFLPYMKTRSKTEVTGWDGVRRSLLCTKGESGADRIPFDARLSSSWSEARELG